MEWPDNVTVEVGKCACGATLRATFQINLKAGQIEYIAPFPMKHQGHDLTYTKNGLMTWT